MKIFVDFVFTLLLCLLVFVFLRMMTNKENQNELSCSILADYLDHSHHLKALKVVLFSIVCKLIVMHNMLQHVDSA